MPLTQHQRIIASFTNKANLLVLAGIRDVQQLKPPSFGTRCYFGAAGSPLVPS